jgi:hypothetical protein
MSIHKAAGSARWLRPVLSVIAAIVVGSGISELAFRQRDGGAFPHLNVYKADPVLGVRLRPGETERVSFGGNPATEVRINADGFRGAELPAPGSDEVLVVGDSQVFGLGVEEGETFSARLGALLGGASTVATVVNAGVPTYGPLEYEKVIAEQLAKRRPKRVLYVVNLANDLFEAERPNTERHAVWDGWAVRKETAPVHVAWFPWRDFLFRKSHAIFALRRAIYRSHAPGPVQSLPSEGTWRDIADAAARAAAEHQEVKADDRRLREMHQVHLRQATDAARKAHIQEEDLAARYINLGVPSVESELGMALRASRAEPGDIVGVDGLNDGGGEYAREVYATAGMILEGARVRQRIERSLREKAKSSEKIAADVNPVLDRAEAAARAVEQVRKEALPELRAWSSLAPSLRRTKALCDAAGATLHVVALPLDVQVSADEWRKYGRAPIDLAPSRVLVDDLLDTAKALDLRAVDLTAPLRAAEPGAFLDHDLHMSPKGHNAVAAALAAALLAPEPMPAPKPGLPPGRTFPAGLGTLRWPWSRAPSEGNSMLSAGFWEVKLAGDKIDCTTFLRDDWLTLHCTNMGPERPVPVGVRVQSAPLGESVVFPTGNKTATSAPSGLAVMVPLVRGQATIVDLRWPRFSRRFEVTWGDGALPTVASSALPAGAASIPDLPAMPVWRGGCDKEAEAAGLTMLPDNPACAAAYPDDCARRVACLQSDPSAPPACPAGSAPVGAFQRCKPLCAAEHPCAAGACVPYQGASVCL